jgi:YesN/AraC family two-component response regulator
MQNKNKLLIVEDNPIVLKYLVKSLESELDIVTAQSGEEAMKHLEKGDVCCVSLDIVLPDINGLELLQKIRENNFKSLPVIITTGKSCQDFAEKAADLGVEGYLIKPYAASKLLDRVKKICPSMGMPSVSKADIHPKLQEAIAYIHQNYFEQLKITPLSKELGVSADYLRRLFKRHTGLTFAIYLNKYRVNKAKSLIMDSEKGISEIMEAVGFQTEQHFFREFKKHTGCTPRKFEENNFSSKY